MARKEIQDTWAIIMMAGMGTRMKSNHPKVLHEVCGQSMARWVLDACDDAGLKKRVIVVGHLAEEIMEEFPNEKYAIQKPQRGTGHAVMVGMEVVPKSAKNIVVLSGDVPCLKARTIRELVDLHKRTKKSAYVVGFNTPDPTGYGRIIRDEVGFFFDIVEQRDLTEEQEEISECNSGIYTFNRKELAEALESISPNERSGEYHLPDALRHMREVGDAIGLAIAEPWIEVIGVNTRQELFEASNYLRWLVIDKHMSNGVTFTDPDTNLIGPKVKLGRDCTILPGSILMGNTQVGIASRIGPYTELQDVKVGRRCQIMHSVLAECQIDDDVKIGPYAHIRPLTRIRKGAKVGNFVEMKKTDFGQGSKSGHLTYLGDAKIGRDVNIGAGTITCNYDGKKKLSTEIGDRVFIGSDSILVAPIKIGNDSYTAAGSTLNKDVPPNSLAFGRAHQHVKKNWFKKKKKK